MDIGILIAGGGLVAAGAVLQRVLPARKPKTKGIQPVCGCKHHRSYHEDGGKGRCSDISRYDGKRCRCQLYSGPITLPELTAEDFPGA